VSGSDISRAICKSAPSSRQITMPAPHHSVFLHAGCPSCHPTNSVKALKARYIVIINRNKTVSVKAWEVKECLLLSFEKQQCRHISDRQWQTVPHQRNSNREHPIGVNPWPCPAPGLNVIQRLTLHTAYNCTKFDTLQADHPHKHTTALGVTVVSYIRLTPQYHCGYVLYNLHNLYLTLSQCMMLTTNLPKCSVR